MNNYAFKSFDNDKENKTVTVTFDDLTAVYPYCWLRDNCKCDKCYDSKIHQRIQHIIEIPSDLKLSKIEKQNDDTLKIKWQDNHMSTYSSKLLYDCYHGNWKKNQINDGVLWAGNNVPKEIAFVDRDEFLKSEDSLKEFLNSLLKFGVAFVDNVKPTMEDTERVIRRVAPPQTTLYGDMWEFTSNLDRADTAYTNIPLAPHTDGIYFVESPGLQVLHCLEHNGTGGNTIVLDGFYVAELLKEKYPSHFKTLTNVMQSAKYEEEGWSQFHYDPVIKIDNLTQRIRQIRYNVYDRTSHCTSTDPNKMVEMHEALCEFGKLCDSEKVKWIFKLKPGRVIFFDNWRVLHGRTGFTGKRVMGGSYVSRGDWLSAARVKGLIK